MLFDNRFIQTTLANAKIIGNYATEDIHVSIDSRTVQKNEIFIALKGNKCDGHQFIKNALEKGSAGAVVCAEYADQIAALPAQLTANKVFIIVPDTHKALIALAKAWRAQFTYPVIGITGTVGKTSTKECLANILDLHGTNYVASLGNQNTLIGISINLLRMRPHHQVAIIEMGTSKRGEMANLADLVRPTTAVITNIGHQHMDGLGSLNDICLEKRDIFKFFSDDSIGIVNGDQSILADVSYTHPVVKFGSKTTNQVQARKIRVLNANIHFILKIYRKKYSIVFKKPHTGAILNALAATTVAHLLGISDEIIIQAIQMPIVVAGRFEECVMKDNRGILINDCYNANPESMKAALLAFQQIETLSPKIAVLGDMTGLGVNSPFWHRQIGRFLRKVPSLSHVILVGSLVEWVKKTAPMHIKVDKVATWQEAKVLLEQELQNQAVVLVKGSQDVELSHLVEHFIR